MSFKFLYLVPSNPSLFYHLSFICWLTLRVTTSTQRKAPFNITKFQGQHRTFVISQPVGWENILDQHLTNILWVLRDLMDWKTDSRTYSLVGRDKIITHMKGKYVMVKGRSELVTFNGICILLFRTAPPPCTFKIVAFTCTSISFIQTTFGIILQAPNS